MELVYLWVEEYKNIHRQGFNFSPRFKCEFKAAYKKDENGNEVLDEEKSELIIEENDDYIENFFGENINVTAIVGKNGSGKSSVLELIYILCNKYNLLEKKAFLIYKKNKQLFILGNTNIIFNNAEYSNFIDDESISWINYSYRRYNAQIEKYIKRQHDYNKYKGHIIWKYTYVFYNYEEIINKIKFDYFFDTLEIEMDLKKPLEYNNIFSDERQGILNDNDKKYIKLILKTIGIPINNGLFNSSLSIEKIDIQKVFLNNLFLYLVNFYEIYATLGENTIILDLDFKSIYDLLKKNSNLETMKLIIQDFKKDLLEKDQDQIAYNLFKSQIQQILYLEKYINKFKYCNKKKKFVLKIDLNDRKLTEDIIYNTSIISGLTDSDNFYIVGFIGYDFSNINRKVYYNDFSDGEKQIFKIIVDILLHIRSNNNIYLIDEIDSFLHPFWSKIILNKLLIIFKDIYYYFNNIKFQLICTTHSPFLISDIPNQNIIFLDTDENGNCMVVDGLKEKKETFGANIHTLLRDSFFMEDGLMGEFAKSKIDEVIKLLNKEQLLNDEIKHCEQIISIIGEPIIKNQLQKMLDSKRLKKIDEIDAIKETIEELQKRLNEL